MSQLASLNAQLAQWDAVDIPAIIEGGDWGKALAYKEQKDKLRTERDQLAAQINSKHAQFTQWSANVTRERAQAEMGALLAKAPEWRNAEKWTAEKSSISSVLSDYGFNSDEINSVIDHRMLLVARDAAKWRELQRTKTDRVKQVREAAPVVKPGVGKPINTGKSDFVKVRSHIRKLGSQGNHRAQEALVEEMFSRTFKA
jgi:hypothetical protein